MSWSNFDNSVQNEGGFMDTSTADSGQADDKGNLKRGQNCVPVMITHLNRYGEKLQVWGNPAKIITFLAIVRKFEQLSTKVSFEFEDETGTIKGIKWLEGENTSFESPVKVDSYARVYGVIREQNDSSYVMIVSIQPMDDLNELLSHLLEVTFIGLQGEKNYHGNLRNGNFINNSIQGNQSVANGSVNASGLNSNQQIVLDIIQNSDPEYGAERDAIKTRVPSNLISKVDDIIEFLQAEGHIYTTKTDDFFKAI